MPSTHTQNVAGVILAGGQSRRMGVKHKGLLPFDGSSLMQHVINRAKPQVEQLVLSVNGDASGYTHFELPIVADITPNHAGPLAGIISVMTALARQSPSPQWLATFPCDAPLAPSDWVTQLMQRAIEGNLEVVVAADDQDKHYTFALWSLTTLPELQRQFSAGQRALYKAIAELRSDSVVCHSHPSSFTNINTPEDFERLVKSSFL